MSLGTGHRLPRALHPVAWWLWAIGLGVAASQTTNPLVLLLLIAATAFVVVSRRGDAPWAGGFRAYLILALIIIGVRVVFRMLLDGSGGAHVLFDLPEIPLPKAAAGIRLGGPVSAESMLAAVYDGLRLATLLLCVGAANVLADPKRLLKATPAALHEVSVAVVVALSVAPQLIESGQRVRRARRLRGEARQRFRLIQQVLIPVLTDALDRSLLLAAAMDARGFGRRSAVARAERLLSGGLVLAGLVAVAVGAYGVLDARSPWFLSWPALVVGVASGLAGLVLGGRQVVRSRYRPDPWRVEEWLVAACGLGVGVLFSVLARDPAAGLGVPSPIVSWPTLPLVGVAGAAVALLPAVIAPPVRLPRPAAARTARAYDPADPDPTNDVEVAA